MQDLLPFPFRKTTDLTKRDVHYNFMQTGNGSGGKRHVVGFSVIFSTLFLQGQSWVCFIKWT